MEPGADGAKVLIETQKTIEFVKENWGDSIGKQYIFWLEQMLKKVKAIERRREIIRLKVMKVSCRCEEIKADDGDSPKILEKRR